MFFWLGLLTFVASLLYFSFFPRNDGLRLIDKPQADALVAPFVAQHMAALKAVKHKNENDVPDYISEMLNTSINLFNQKSANIGVVSSPAIRSYLPQGTVLNDFSDTLSGSGFASIVLCINNTSGELSASCGLTDENAAYTTSDFLITYGAIPSYWGDYFTALSPRALGERLFLTDYTQQYHLPATCGVLSCTAPTAPAGTDYQPGSNCVVDTTRHRVVYLPNAFMDKVPIPANRDVLVCISRLSAAYSFKTNPPQIIYPQL